MHNLFWKSIFNLSIPDEILYWPGQTASGFLSGRYIAEIIITVCMKSYAFGYLILQAKMTAYHSPVLASKQLTGGKILSYTIITFTVCRDSEPSRVDFHVKRLLQN